LAARAAFARRARRIADAKIGAQKRGSEFGDKLFHSVGVIAKAFAELAIAAALMARVMGQFMQERGEARRRPASAGSP
jgi:hypothetical protein